MTLLRLSDYDTDIFYRYKQVILTACTQEAQSIASRNDLIKDLEHLCDHVLFLNPLRDIYFELARIYMSLGEYQTAYELFENSIQYIANHHVTWHNMGICSFYLQDYENAKSCFMRALEIKPTYMESQSWLRQLTSDDYEMISQLSTELEKQALQEGRVQTNDQLDYESNPMETSEDFDNIPNGYKEGEVIEQEMDDSGIPVEMQDEGDNMGQYEEEVVSETVSEIPTMS